MDYIIIVKSVALALCAILWRLGGAAGYRKAWRRFGCPILIGLVRFELADWCGLLSIPLLVGAYHVGYGENSGLTKWLKNKYIVRAGCGLLYSLAGYFIMRNNIWLFGFDVIFCTCFVMLAGNQKFKWNDKSEESAIGVAVTFLKIWK